MEKFTDALGKAAKIGMEIWDRIEKAKSDKKRAEQVRN